MRIEFGDIESGEAGFELILEMRLVLGIKVILFADGSEKGTKDGNLGGILSLANLETFVFMATPVLHIRLPHVFKEVGFGDG